MPPDVARGARHGCTRSAHPRSPRRSRKVGLTVWKYVRTVELAAEGRSWNIRLPRMPAGCVPAFVEVMIIHTGDEQAEQAMIGLGLHAPSFTRGNPYSFAIGHLASACGRSRSAALRRRRGRRRVKGARRTVARDLITSSSRRRRRSTSHHPRSCRSTSCSTSCSSCTSPTTSSTPRAASAATCSGCASCDGRSAGSSR